MNNCDVARQLLIKEVNGLKQSTRYDKFVGTVKTFMLTNPGTHTANVTGNLTKAALEHVSSVPATIADHILAALPESAITGRRSKAVAGWGDVARGLKEGGQEFVTTLKTGVAAGDGKFSGPVKTGNLFMDFISEWTSRFLKAEDAAAKQVAIERSIGEQARVKAANEGLKGEAYRARVKSLTETPTNRMILDAGLAADYATFNQGNRLAEGYVNYKNSLKAGSVFEKGGALLMDAAAPFPKVPTNVAGSFLDYTPGSLLLEIARQFKDPNQRRLVESFGRNVTGAGIVAAGWILAENRLATGTNPAGRSGSEERANQALRGQQENAVKIGGQWYDTSRIGPGGMLLNLGATLHRFAHEEDAKKRSLADRVAGAVAGQALETTFIPGVQETLSALKPEEERSFAGDLTEEAQGFASGFVPNAVAALAKGFDTRERDMQGDTPLDTALRHIQSKVPGWRLQLPAKPDLLGREIERTQGIVGSLLSPARYTTERIDPITREVERLGIRLKYPPAYLTVDGERVSLTQAERRTLLTETRQPIEEGLSALFSNPAYHRESPEEQKTDVQTLINTVRAGWRAEKARQKLEEKERRDARKEREIQRAVH